MVGYHPEHIGVLTYAPDRGGGQCQVGSLTGAVASLVREDRDGRTAGAPVVPPGAQLGSYVRQG